MRDKKKVDLRVPLTAWNDINSLIPEDYLGAMNDYTIAGGLVIREVSGRYLRSHGGNWQMRVGARLAYYYQTKRSTPEERGDRIVICSGILPDTINIGYQHVRNEIVTTVNGITIQNIDDVFKAIDAEKGLHRIGIQSYDVDLHLDPAKLDEANARILESYRIPAIDSRDLEAMTKENAAQL
jgi:hypothetical protein